MVEARKCLMNRPRLPFSLALCAQQLVRNDFVLFRVGANPAGLKMNVFVKGTEGANHPRLGPGD